MSQFFPWLQVPSVVEAKPQQRAAERTQLFRQGFTHDICGTADRLDDLWDGAT
jgi:hypothetical protein